MIKSELSQTCWEYDGQISSNGYGKVWYEGKKVLVHRAAYEILVGPIPDGLTIDHRCTNKKCYNISHLDVVTLRENLQRANGWTETHCNKGHLLDDDNLRLYYSKSRKRYDRKCRACLRLRDKRGK